MLPSRLNAVTLVTGDVPARRAFYESLGWRSALPPGDDYARFELGGATLSIWNEREARAEIADPIRSRGFDFGGFTLAAAVGREDQVDEALETARAAGAPIMAEPVARPFGGRSGYFADPAGVAWEVVWIPNTTIDESGVLSFDG